MPVAIRLCILALLLVMAASSMAAVEDDWSVLTEAEIREALGVGDRDADMGSRRHLMVWLWLGWGAGGVLTLAWLSWVGVRGALRRWRGRPPKRRPRWWASLLTTLALLSFLIPSPWTWPLLWQETRIEINTWRMYLSGRPLVLQGSVLHSETEEPLEGVLVRYSLRRLARFQTVASSGGCPRFQLLLRTNRDGRWRVELPPKPFARYMAEYAHLQTSPIVHLYAHGMEEDTLAKYTEEERQWIQAISPWGIDAIKRRQREMKDDRREYMKPAGEPMARLGFLGGGHCGEWTRVAGPKTELFAAIRREMRELWCAGPTGGGPWPEGTRWSFPWPEQVEVAEFRSWLEERTAELVPSTNAFDAAVCQALHESKR